MTNGNDIIEYEEQNSERLQEQWCEKLGAPLERLDDTDWVKKNIDTNQAYWDFVTDDYSEAGM